MLKYRNKYSAEDVKKRWAELSDLTKPTLHESANQTSRSTLLNKIGAADGKTYGIVLESSKYFVKVADTEVDESDSKDFKYIGGQANSLHERFDSYSAAVRRLTIKVASLRESFHMQEESSDDEEDALLADLAAKEQEKDTETVDTVEDEGAVDDLMADMPADMSGEAVADVDAADALGLDAVEDEDALGLDAEDSDESKFDGMGDEADDKDSDDPAGQVQELMGEIGVALDSMGEMPEAVLKNILNTMITKCERGLQDASDETIEKLTSRIEKRGKKLSEEESEDGQMLDEYDHDMELGRGITFGKGIDQVKGECETCLGDGMGEDGPCVDCGGSGTDGSEEGPYDRLEMDENDFPMPVSPYGKNSRMGAAKDQEMAAQNRKSGQNNSHMDAVKKEFYGAAKSKIETSKNRRNNSNGIGKPMEVLPESNDERDYERNAGEDMDSAPAGMEDGDVSFEQFTNQYADHYPEDDDTTRAQRIIDYLENYGSSVSEFCLNQAFDDFNSDMTPEVKQMVLDAAQQHPTLKPFLGMLNYSPNTSQGLNENYLINIIRKLVNEEKKKISEK